MSLSSYSGLSSWLICILDALPPSMATGQGCDPNTAPFEPREPSQFLRSTVVSSTSATQWEVLPSQGQAGHSISLAGSSIAVACLLQ